VFDIQNYPSFLAAILVFQLVPGAGTLAILNATARNGAGAGFGAPAMGKQGVPREEYSKLELTYQTLQLLGIAA
jgi:hypothetical protein